jgi:hypothetical protein
VIENLDSIISLYLKLIMLKEHELEATVEGEYSSLYEVTEYERRLVDDITGLLKYIVPDLIYLKEDRDVKSRMLAIDEMQDSVLRETLKIRHLLEKEIEGKKKILENIRVFPKTSTSQPSIISIRA